KAVDQEGEPTQVYASFFRSGPDDLQDGDGNANGFTDPDTGEISYVFQGAKAGTATITVVPRQGGRNGALIPQGQVSDTIEFVAPTKPQDPKPEDPKPVKATIKPKLKAK